MNIIHVQECKSTGGWVPVRIRSTTTPQIYTVFCNPWGEETEYICECKGFEYTGHCKHQAIAQAKICGWTQTEGPEIQTEAEVAAKICPRCRERTQWTMEVEE